MFVADVIGTLVASVKDPSLAGIKLMLVQPLDENCEAKGSPLVATDAIGIGVGERAFCVLGREAALALPHTFAPVDAAIVGIVDRYDVVKGRRDPVAQHQAERLRQSQSEATDGNRAEGPAIEVKRDPVAQRSDRAEGPAIEK